MQILPNPGRPVTFFSIEEVATFQGRRGLRRRALLFFINLLSRMNSPEGVSRDDRQS